jgi:hypothetical protein
VKATPVTTSYMYRITIVNALFKEDIHSTEEVSLVLSLINACLLGDPPNKSNPNFLPDFLQKYIKFEKVELSEEQCIRRDEIHFVHKEGIVIAKKAIAMNLLT